MKMHHLAWMNAKVQFANGSAVASATRHNSLLFPGAPSTGLQIPRPVGTLFGHLGIRGRLDMSVSTGSTISIHATRATSRRAPASAGPSMTPGGMTGANAPSSLDHAGHLLHGPVPGIGVPVQGRQSLAAMTIGLTGSPVQSFHDCSNVPPCPVPQTLRQHLRRPRPYVDD